MQEIEESAEDFSQLLDCRVGRSHFDMVTTANLIQLTIGRYVFASEFVKDKTVLDVASGIGYGSRYLSKRGATLVTGVDISSDLIAEANKRYRREGLRFLEADATKMPFEDCAFDVLVSFETIEHIEQYRVFLSECTRVLKNDGLFVCSTPNKRMFRYYSDESHLKEFYPGEFFELVGQYFSEVSCFGQRKVNFLKPDSFAAARLRERASHILGVRAQRALWNVLRRGYARFRYNYEQNVQAQRFLENDDFEDALLDEYKVGAFKDTSFSTFLHLVALCRRPKN
jgi:ubiquinone/menaquinone biosynthesis C-methylase UbiE